MTSPRKQYLKIAAMNVNSIISHTKRFALLEFINNNKLDLVLISETKLNKRHKIVLDNHDIIRTDRPNATKGGGTAIIIKNDIDYEKIYYPSSNHNEVTEYSIIKIKLSHQKFLFIISIYANNKDKRIFITEFEHIFENLKLNNTNNYYIIAGDLNARNISWGDRSNNFKGNLLKDWLDNPQNIKFKIKTYIPNSPTFIPNATVIDLCFTDSRIELSNLDNGKIKTSDFWSDHKALLFDIDLSKVNEEFITADPTRNHRFMFKKTKWKKFERHLEKSTNLNIPCTRNLDHNEINLYLNQTTENIKKSIEATVPKFRPQNNTLYYINTRIKTLTKIKSNLLTLLHKYKQRGTSPILVQLLQDHIKISNERLKSEFQKANTSYWETLHKSIDYRESNSFLPKVNKWFRARSSPEIETLHIDRNDRSLLCVVNTNNLRVIDDKYIIESPIDKINIMGKFYEKINSPRYTNNNSTTKRKVSEKIAKYKEELALRKISTTTIMNFSNNNPSSHPNPTNDELKIYFCNLVSLSKILTCLPNKCSSGLDNIPP